MKRTTGKWDNGLTNDFIRRINVAIYHQDINEKALHEVQIKAGVFKPQGYYKEVSPRIESVAFDPHDTWESKGQKGRAEWEKKIEAEKRQEKLMSKKWKVLEDEELESIGSGDFESGGNMTQKKHDEVEAQRLGYNAYDKSKNWGD